MKFVVAMKGISKTCLKLTDETTKLYKKQGPEIYDMLKIELNKYWYKLNLFGTTNKKTVQKNRKVIKT